MTATEVRETLHEVAAAATPPPLDRVAFQAAVRDERRRRVRRRAAGVVVAAAALAVVTAGVATLADRGPEAVGPAGPGEVALVPGSVPQPVYVLRDHRLVAIDPQGTVHDLRQVSEAVVGATSEMVLAIDGDSHVVRFDAHHGEDGPDAPWTFGRVASPVSGPVDSIAMSGDGRYVAWRDLDGRLTTLDLKAGTRRAQDLRDDGSVVSVSDAGVLLYDGQAVFLETPRGTRVDVPAPAGGVGLPTAAQGSTLSVSSGTTTWVEELRDGDRLVRLDEVKGMGTLAPDGRSMLLVRTTRDDRSTALVWTPERTTPLTGLPRFIDQTRWVDERTVLVVAGAPQRLFSCDVQRLSCGVLPVRGTIRIGS